MDNSTAIFCLQLIFILVGHIYELSFWMTYLPIIISISTLITIIIFAIIVLIIKEISNKMKGEK